MLHLIASNLPPLEWAFQHLQVVGWPALCVIAWKVSGAFTRFVDKLDKTVTQIDTMASNHFPHMEDSLKNQDVLMHSMNENLKVIASNTGRRRTTDYPVDGNHV